MLPHSLLFLIVLFFASCAAPGEGGEDAQTGTGDLHSRIGPQIDLEFEPALEAVIQALDDGNEAVARATLNRLLSRKPGGETLEFALALERILDGRQLARGLDLRLEATLSTAAGGRWQLTLVANQRTEQELVLRCAGAELRQVILIVDPDGHEQRSTRREPMPWPEELVLPPEEELRLALLDLELPAPPGLLALSSRLVLEIMPGELVDPEGRYLPAQELTVEPLEIVRLASYLPTAPVEPEELARYVRSGRIFLPALMERTVRILPARRDEALDLLVPQVESMSLVELDLLVPALRWLSRTTRPGGDPEAWRAWMGRRGRGISEEAAEPGGLDLPGG